MPSLYVTHYITGDGARITVQIPDENSSVAVVKSAIRNKLLDPPTSLRETWVLYPRGKMLHDDTKTLNYYLGGVIHQEEVSLVIQEGGRVIENHN